MLCCFVVLNIITSALPGDDSCNVSVIALDVLENKVPGAVVSAFTV